MAGTLFVVATPIGNLEDITLRSLRILRQAAVIACEDTRVALKLVRKYEIKKELISYYQPRERQRLPHLLALLASGKDVALISDTGTPGISDPGFRLVREAIGAGIRVVPIPGPAALTAALSASGMPTHRFLFLGFPPPKEPAVRKKLESLKSEEGTLIFYVPSRKTAEFLGFVRDILGNRPVVVARETTKFHEEFLRGSVEEVMKLIKNKEIRGEVTLLVGGVGK